MLLLKTVWTKPRCLVWIRVNLELSTIFDLQKSLTYQF